MDTVQQQHVEQDEEAVCCAKCNELPNDVLILTCDHNLCLRCASLNLLAQNQRSQQVKQGQKQQNSFQTVICEICQIATVLDPASATELLTMDHSPREPIEAQDAESLAENYQQEYADDFQRDASNIPQPVNYQHPGFHQDSFQNTNMTMQDQQQRNLPQTQKPHIPMSQSQAQSQRYSNQSNRFPKQPDRPLSSQGKAFHTAQNMYSVMNQQQQHQQQQIQVQQQPPANTYSDRNQNFDVMSQGSNNTSRFNFQNGRPSQPNFMRTGNSNHGGTSTFGPQSQLPGGGAPCGQHPEEFVQYFCFTCQCPPVCAECVIHGEHQGHQVQTIRKALPEISTYFDQLVHSIVQKVDELQIQETKLEARKRDINEGNQQIRHVIATQFEELRQKIDQKEREILTQMDESNRKNQAEVEQLVRLLKGRCVNLQETENHIVNQRQNSDEVSLIAFYAEKYQILNDQVMAESEILMQPSIQSVITGEQVDLRNQMYQRSIDTFAGDMDIIYQNVGMLEFENQENQDPNHNHQGFSNTGKSQPVSQMTSFKHPQNPPSISLKKQGGSMTHQPSKRQFPAPLPSSAAQHTRNIQTKNNSFTNMTKPVQENRLKTPQQNMPPMNPAVKEQSFREAPNFKRQNSHQVTQFNQSQPIDSQRRNSNAEKITNVVQSAQNMVNNIQRTSQSGARGRENPHQQQNVLTDIDPNLTNLEKYKLRLKSSSQNNREEKPPQHVALKNTVQETMKKLNNQGAYSTNQFSSLDEKVQVNKNTGKNVTQRKRDYSSSSDEAYTESNTMGTLEVVNHPKKRN